MSCQRDLKRDPSRRFYIGDSDRLASRFSAAVAQGQDKLGHFLKQWGHACEESLASVTDDGFKPEHLRMLDEMSDTPISETDLLSGVFRGLAKDSNVSLSRDDIPGLVAAHGRDQSGAVQAAPVTRASIVNAITRHAHENVGRFNPSRQSDLEREAGALLVTARGSRPAPLPFYPPAQLVG